MGPQRRLGIYVGYETSSIIRYVEPLTADVFIARFADCHFNEAIFPPLGGEKKTMRKMSHGANLLCCILILANEIGDIDEMFSYSITSDIISSDDDPEPKSIIDCQNRPDWDKWKDAMQTELNSLNKRMIFGPIVTTPRDVKPVGCRSVYVNDLNITGTNKEINEVVMHLKEDIEMKDLVNLLARFSSFPTKRHWNGIKHIFRYLRGATNLGLFYSNNSKQGLIGYADACYLSDPHKARFQTGYVFLNGGTAISRRSQK
uniref:Retrovirus-related Pol polyprotein from transposon TNT 1-94 n=1 Tax=Tanacetum cinerariifolium TaxID=118510 RepID=A0A6L2KZL6_TANCI|nr:retrovirus-related Pol polyprotein from transposon TNT 1-94 [Tanacetum cinerariifolium]